MFDFFTSGSFFASSIEVAIVCTLCAACAIVFQKIKDREDTKALEHEREKAKVEAEREKQKALLTVEIEKEKAQLEAAIERERAKTEAEFPTVISEARVCERCGAPLKTNVCEYCGSKYDFMRTKAK